METMNNVWLRIEPIVTNATFIALMTAILTAVIKGTINRKFRKLDLVELFRKTNEMSLEKFKGMTFKHDIQPLVDKSLLETKAELKATFDKKFDKQNDTIKQLIRVVGAFMSYFDDANIPKERKDYAKALLESTLEGIDKEEIIVESNIVVEEDNKRKKNNYIER